MRKEILCILFLFVLSTAHAIWIDIPENSGKQLFDHISYGKETTEISFSLNGYEMETVNEKGEIYQKISYLNEGEFLETGKPTLPRFTRMIAIPDQGDVSIEILDFEEEILSNLTIYPSQELQLDNQPQNGEFIIDERYYSFGEVFPSRIIGVGEPAIMRDLRVVTVTVNPFQYDPKSRELKIIKNIEFVVNCEGSGGVNIKTRTRPRSRFFESTYKTSVLNYNSTFSREDEFHQPCYLFIYPNDATVLTNLENLSDWKRQKGFEVHLASTAVTGTGLNSIKNYIQDAYDTWPNPPEFICLVGDAGGSYNIPTDHIGYGEGDHGYVMLEGGDVLADAFIGRLSFNSIIELQTIIYKILNYEKEPYMGTTDWYEKVLLVADPYSSSGTSTIDTKQHIKTMMLVNNPDINPIEVYSGAFSSQMTSNINSGVSYFNYRGWLGMSGFGNSSIQSLNNGPMLPVAVILTCGTGDFEGTSNCRSELFLKVGSPGYPKGGIAAIGTATCGTHTTFNNCMDAGIYYGIFSDCIYHMGGAFNRGKVNLYNNYPQNPANGVYNFAYWNNLMGDPGMELWTGVPQEMVVTYETQVSLGTNYLQVTVEDANNNPLENAWVTALMGDDDIFVTGYTDTDGNIILPISAAIEGTAYLTVTKHNYIPHLGGFDVGQSDRFVNVFEITIDDDNLGTSSGNGDGIVNPGEDIELNVSLMNFGTSSATSVTATISTEDEFITITDNTEDYGDIASYASVYSSEDFDFSVDANVLGGTEAELDMLIEDGIGNQWTDVIYIQIEGANLYAVEYSIVNDPNFTLDPGETAEMVVTIENIGSVNANAVSGTLIFTDSCIDIVDEYGFFGNVLSGNQAANNTDRFELTASSQIIPGSQFILELQLYNADGYDHTVTFPLYVGTVSITDPIGPDGYGYYCYDDGDVNYYNVPVYDWIEINQIGTQISIYDPGNTGAIQDITLPITFKFYGVEYNTITVCSNGWIAPGNTDDTSFMNWQIPGPMGPSPMIAPFWDDLKTSGGGIYYYYNSALHCFIIEWDHLHNEYNNAEETFQVILYDAYYYPTSTEDSQIKFQYQVVNNVDQGSYPSQHGQYATVGIEDHTGTIGLEYTFNNSYPTPAKTLQNEMALLFTGPPIPFEEPFIVLGGVTIYDENGNGLVDYAENVDLDITLNNLGENPATGVNVTISTTDEYITINQNSSSYNNIPGYGSSTNLSSFNIDVAEDCPDAHIVMFEIAVMSNENNWDLNFTLDLNAPVIEFYSLYVNDGANNILDPGETADILVSFINNGGAEAYSLIADITTSDIYVTINSSNYDIGSITSGSVGTAIFNVTADISAPVGHCAIIDWEVNGDLNYANSGEIMLVISQVPVLVEEFFNTFPPAGWTTTSTSGQINWASGSGNYAGGTPPEAQFSWSPSTTATQRLITMPINTTGSASLELEFKHMVNHYSGTYELRVETTSDGTNWNTVATWPAQNQSATTESLTVTTPDVGSPNFQLAFTFDGYSWNINYWYVDNVYIEGGAGQELGFISGNVSLIGGSGDVEDVSISAGIYMASPDDSGYYLLPIDPGMYDVTASLTGYGTVTENNVIVVTGQASSVDFELNFLEVPQNLMATVISNDVTLEWDAPATLRDDSSLYPEKKLQNNDRMRAEISEQYNEKREQILTRSLTGYKVYRDGIEIAEITSPSTTTYLDEFLNGGDYSYYITAVYDGVDESLPSNIEDVTIVLEPATDLTATSQPPDIHLNWVAPSFGRYLTGYKIYRDEIEIDEVTEVSYIDENVPTGTYTYFITAAYGPFESVPSNEVIIEHVEAQGTLIPAITELQGNYPNPFNPAVAGAGRSPTTTISYSIKEDSKVTLEIYNIKGQKVKTLVNEFKNAGYHKVVWDGRDYNKRNVSSGVYFSVFDVKNDDGDFTSVKKIILLK